MKTHQAGYINRVSHHIYASPAANGCKTLDDWIELCAASLDQAGFSVKSQDKIRALLETIAAQENIT